jgi:hypothetical protein
MGAGNGCSNVVGSREELIERLREDGAQFKTADFFTLTEDQVRRLPRSRPVAS